MKSKITRGKGFRGALDYAFDVGKDATHDKDAELIGGNMAGENPRELAHEFGAVRAIRPDIEKPVWHSSLRCPTGETPTDEKWNAIAKDYMQGLGYDTEKTPYCIVRHKDNHIHIVASRINLDGGLYLGKNEHLKATRLTQELEKAHGLTITKGPEYTIDEQGKERVKMPDKARPRSKELKMMERTGKPSPRMQLQDIIDKATADRPKPEEYEKRLEAEGVEYRKGSNGYSYSIEGKAFKGSQLGAAYKWDRFQDRLDLGQDQAKELTVGGVGKGELERERVGLKELQGELAAQKQEVYARLKELNAEEAADRAGRITGNEGKGFGPTVELLYKIAAMIDKMIPDVGAALRRIERETRQRELDEIKKQMEATREEIRLNRLKLQTITPQAIKGVELLPRIKKQIEGIDAEIAKNEKWLATAGRIVTAEEARAEAASKITNGLTEAINKERLEIREETRRLAVGESTISSQALAERVAGVEVNAARLERYLQQPEVQKQIEAYVDKCQENNKIIEYTQYATAEAKGYRAELTKVEKTLAKDKKKDRVYKLEAGIDPSNCRQIVNSPDFLKQLVAVQKQIDHPRGKGMER